MSQRLCSL